MDKDVIVIGGGAAGLMAAIEAGKRGRSVIVLEHSDKIGNKIRLSGGGRCNFTNLNISTRNFVSQNPHFCKSALTQFTPQDFIALVENHDIAYHEKKSGQLFCDGSSEEIVSLLEKECQTAQVNIHLNYRISEITKNDRFNIRANDEVFHSKSLIIATGGLSFPKTGTTSFGYETAKRFGLKLVPCRPALVPFTFNKEDLRTYSELAGISLPVKVSYGGQDFFESILFTHKGLSGPAILQISSYWKPGDSIFIDLLPEKEIMDELIECRNHGKEITHLLAHHFSKRFAQKWCERNLPAKPMSHRSGKEIKAISDRLHRWQVAPIGTEGYDKAEVTAGGVDTNELSSKTMESKKIPGLYFAGEILDVTGQLGGYNLQWAWSSGFAAGISA